MVIEVEALLLLARALGSHRGSLELLPWQREMEEKEGPACSSLSLPHTPSWLDNRRMEAQGAPAWSPRRDLPWPRDTQDTLPWGHCCER